MIDHGDHGAFMNKALKTQIITVREVSMVERQAADAYLDVATPKLLKHAIEQMLINV